MTRHTILSTIAAAALSLAVPITTPAQETTMSALPTPIESGFADVNGVNIWYQTYGKGDPLILIHGGFGAVEMFGPNLELLAEGRRVIGVDLQAHGGTGPLGRPMSFEAMATDVAELIRFLGYEKADIMGYSLGGATATRVAIDHPEVVDRLVVVSTAWAFSNWHTYNYEGMKTMGTDPASTAQGLVGTPQHQGCVTKAPGGEASWNEAVDEFVSFIGQDYDWSAEVPSITAPTLLIYADWDAVRMPAIMQFYDMLGGGAQDANWDRSGMGENHLAVIPNATHYEIVASTAVSDVAIPFLDGYPQ